MAVAEADDDDAIYATFSYLNYKREQEAEGVKRRAPSPPSHSSRPPLNANNSYGQQSPGNPSQFVEFCSVKHL